MIATEVPLEERLKKWASDCDRTNYGCQFHKMLTDAAAELARLTAANAEQAARIAEFEATMQSHEDAYRLGGRLADEKVRRLEAERDAAVEHIKSYFDFYSRCEDCANWDGHTCSATGKASWTYQCEAVFRWRGLRREGEQG